MLEAGNWIIDIMVVGVGFYFLYDFARAYQRAIGGVWQKSVKGAKGAAASLWSGFTVGVSLMAAGVASLADILHQPTVAQDIQTYLGNPKYIAVLMVVCSIIAEIARRQRQS